MTVTAFYAALLVFATLGKCIIIRPLGYERVYLPLCKVADTPFHIKKDGMYVSFKIDLV